MLKKKFHELVNNLTDTINNIDGLEISMFTVKHEYNNTEPSFFIRDGNIVNDTYLDINTQTKFKKYLKENNINIDENNLNMPVLISFKDKQYIAYGLPELLHSKINKTKIKIIILYL